jgi:hypothetical protein
LGILFVNALSLATLVYAAVDSITTNKAESVPNYMLYVFPAILAMIPVCESVRA